MAEPFPTNEPSRIDLWVSTDRAVAHPDAPAGGGGFGSFRSPALLGSAGDVFDAFPHPLSPAGRQLDPADLQDKAEELQQPAQKSPPLVTKDETKKINGIDVTIKADEMNVADVKEGEGDCSMPIDPGEVPEADHDGPEDETKVDKKKHKITEVLGPLPVITATIRTRYKSSSSPAGKSAYGRGTTTQDKKDGNTSLAFHESCHRQDFLDFVKNNKLPTFGGKVGMTIEQWEKAVADYTNAVFAYQDKAAAFTEKNTDEVGNPPKSQHKP